MDSEEDLALARQYEQDRKRERSEDIQRRLQERERQRRVRYDANQRYTERTREADHCNLTYKSQMKDFTEAVRKMDRSNIFAHPSASGDGKGYLHGQYKSIWKLCHKLEGLSNHAICLDEMIPYESCVRVFFDMEIKRGTYQDWGPLATESYVTGFYEAMKGHVEGSIALART